MLLLPCLHCSGKWGYINTIGRWQIDPIYDHASPYVKAGVASATFDNNSSWAMIDLSGRSLFAPRHYEGLIVTEDGRAIVAETDGSVVIDRFGMEIWRPDCEDISAAGSGLFVEWFDSWSRCRLVKIGGGPVIDKDFREMSVYAERKVVLVREDAGYTLMDFESKVLRLYSRAYDHLDSFDEMGRAVFSSHGMCGVISETEAVLLPPIFRIVDFCLGRNKTVVVCRNKEDGLFNIYDATDGDFVGEGFECVARSPDENFFWGFKDSWSLYRIDGSCVAHDVCMEIKELAGGMYQGLIDGDGRMFYGFLGPKGFEIVKCHD